MNDFWQTPEHILQKIRNVLGVDYFDPCPIGPKFDGLTVEWSQQSYINPPYSRGSLQLWSKKAISEHSHFLLSSTDTNFIWLINYGATENRKLIKQRASAICDLYRRVNFVHPETGQIQKGNDRDSVLYLWGPRVKTFQEQFEDLGEIFVKPNYLDKLTTPKFFK